MLNLTSYRWLTRLLYPVLWAWDTWRAYRQPIYRTFRHERWSRDLPVPLGDRCIWIHAVSVGETQACAPLLKALLAQYPQHSVLLTHMTPTGRDTGATLFAKEIADRRVQQCYLPYDVAHLGTAFLTHFRPVHGIMMETEVWPNIVAVCAALQIPLGLANGRMSEKTLKKTLRFKSLAQKTYQSFRWVAAQSEADAQHLAQLRSAPIAITGNLKFDASMNQPQWQQGQAFKTLHARTTLALASTREGEEALLLEALLPWLNKQPAPPLLLLIPRHPKRADALLTLLGGYGLRVAQRSVQQAPDPLTQVYLCDTLGEMWFYYGASDIAVIGGGWLALGGQNLIEPCMAGCVTVVGPYMFNFADATRLALADSAIIQTELALLTQHLDRLLVDSERRKFAKHGQQFAKHHVGATAKHVSLIDANLK